MSFRTQYIQIDGSLNVDGSIFVYQEILAGGDVDLSTFDINSYVNSSSYYDASIMRRFLPNPSIGLSGSPIYEGLFVRLIADTSISANIPVFVTSGGGVGICEADASNKMPCIGVTKNAGNAGDNIDVFIYGVIRNTSSLFNTFAIGKPVYMGTDPYFTTTIPSSAGYCVQVLGISDSESSMVFFPTYDFMVLK
jgi:hypothetical protein